MGEGCGGGGVLVAVCVCASGCGGGCGRRCGCGCGNVFLLEGVCVCVFLCEFAKTMYKAICFFDLIHAIKKNMQSS